MTEVTTDTVVVNALAELGGWAGQALAGEYANQAAERYKNTMEKDYHENLDGHYLVKKKKLKSNFERHQVMVNKKLTKLDPIIGNAGPGNPSVSNFTKGSRPIWSRKWFTGGGKNAFINTPKQVFYVVVPTSQQTCLHQKQVEIIGHFSSLIIIFFIVIKKVSYRFKKLKTRISGYLKQIREGFVVCDETFIIL